MEKSDIKIGFRDLASEIEYRFETLENDKAWNFTVDHMSDRIYELENKVTDLREEVFQLLKQLTEHKHGE